MAGRSRILLWLAALVVLLYGWLPELHQVGHRIAGAAGPAAACARSLALPTSPAGLLTIAEEHGGCGFCAIPRAGQQSVSRPGAAVQWSMPMLVAAVAQQVRTVQALPFVRLQLARAPPALPS